MLLSSMLVVLNEKLVAPYIFTSLVSYILAMAPKSTAFGEEFRPSFSKSTNPFMSRPEMNLFFANDERNFRSTVKQSSLTA